MASLMEELLSVLEEEKNGYIDLYNLSEPKRDAIVHNKVEDLEKITSMEEVFQITLKNLEKKRIQTLKDMAVVMGHDGEDMTVTDLAELLTKQPKEREALLKARDELIEAASKMRFMNEQNRILLEQALDMVEFDLTLFKSMRRAPETANYGKNGENTGDILGGGGFDAKQ